MSLSSRSFSSAILALFLSGCQEEAATVLVPSEATATVHLSPSPLASGIDWNRELALAESPEVYQKAASAAGTDVASLKAAIKIEADLSQRQVRFVSTHPDQENSQKYVSSVAEAYRMLRTEREGQKIREKITNLEAQLNEQTAELDLKQEALGNIIEANGGVPYLPSKAQQMEQDRDRMTYDKAKKALAEDPE